MKSREEILQTLPQFYGTENYHKLSPFTKLVATDGVFYVAEACGAYWLTDEIAFNQTNDALDGQWMQVWKLDVADEKGVLTVEDGNNNVLFTKEIPYTNFPLDSIEIWVMDGVMLLPSEY